jgi:Fic-DOC domain mobile mystery protein B
MKLTYPDGATPLDLDEVHNLIPDYISTMSELNQVEQSNISDAFVWAGKQSLTDLLTATFVFKLHKKMFDQVWRWAGKARHSNKNIGVIKEQIANELGRLLGDVQYWTQHKTFSDDEIAMRFHHRLVQIHIFPNGNGRHARLMTDLLLRKNGRARFTWGSKASTAAIEVEGPTRAKYIAALKSADRDDFLELLKFVRS